MLLVGIVTAAGLIRIPGLLHDGLWRDQAYVYVDVIAPTLHSFLARVVETEYHPPLYFLLSYAWVRLAGISELSLVGFPFLCSILTVPLVYRLGAMASSAVVGLLAAAMFAVSPLAILESGDYLYPLMGLLCTALAVLVMAARREPIRPGRLVGVAAVTMFTTYTHYAALFYVPMLAVWALGSPRGPRHGAAIAAALLLGALPFLFWLPAFSSQPNPYLLKVASNVGTPLLGSPPNAAEKLGFFAWTVVRSMPLWPEKLAIVLVLLLAAALATIVASRKINADAIAMGSIYGLSLAVVSAAGRLNVRYVVPFEGLLCVFLAWVVVDCLGRARLPRWEVVAAAVVAVFIVTEDVIFAAHTASMPKSGIRTFVASQAIDPATLYVVVPDSIAATFAFYARDARVSYTAFGQTDHPEIFRYASDASNYGPRSVRDAAARLRRMARAYTHLDLIVDDAADLQKVWRDVIYPSPARGLIDWAKARYPLVAQAHYPGRLESVTVYRFCARASAC